MFNADSITITAERLETTSGLIDFKGAWPALGKKPNGRGERRYIVTRPFLQALLLDCTHKISDLWQHVDARHGDGLRRLFYKSKLRFLPTFRRSLPLG